jgi:hypothetical protein
MQIIKPNLSFSRRELDFGIGFYATSIKEQAVIDAHLHFSGSYKI